MHHGPDPEQQVDFVTVGRVGLDGLLFSQWELQEVQGPAGPQVEGGSERPEEEVGQKGRRALCGGWFCFDLFLAAYPT